MPIKESHVEPPGRNRTQGQAPQGSSPTAARQRPETLAGGCPACGRPPASGQESAQEYDCFLARLFNRQDKFEQSLAAAIRDGFAQHLVGALLYLQRFEHLAAVTHDTRESLHTGLELLQESIREAGRIAARLRPPTCAEQGVSLGIECLVREAEDGGRPSIVFHPGDDVDRLPPGLEGAVYRIVRELLANACRHSGSAEVCVEAGCEENRWRLAVEDWGVGFDSSSIPGHALGLQETGRRVRVLGGEMLIDTRPGKGTRVVVSFPLDGLPRAIAGDGTTV